MNTPRKKRKKDNTPECSIVFEPLKEFRQSIAKSIAKHYF